MDSILSISDALESNHRSKTLYNELMRYQIDIFPYPLRYLQTVIYTLNLWAYIYHFCDWA